MANGNSHTMIRFFKCFVLFTLELVRCATYIGLLLIIKIENEFNAKNMSILSNGGEDMSFKVSWKVHLLALLLSCGISFLMKGFIDNLFISLLIKSIILNITRNILVDLMLFLFIVFVPITIIHEVVIKNGQISFLEESDDEKDRQANELRNLIGKLPNLAIYIDEVHHAIDEDIKLRGVVNNWGKNKTINCVIGFSGTPYLQKA